MRLVGPVSFVRVAVLVASSMSMSMVACGGVGVPTRPSAPPSPSPPPAPSSQTWTLSGTISETFPTASTRIAGASVTVMDGPNVGWTATSDANGVFHLAQLNPGTVLIRTQAANYVDRSELVTLGEDHTVTIELNPAFRMTTTARNDSIIGGGTCFGWWDYLAGPRAVNEPCKADYVFNVHHDGTLSADLTWTDPRMGLALELYWLRDWQEEIQGMGTNGVGLRHQLTFALHAHSQYLLRVRNFSSSGGAAPAGVTPFSLTMTHPN